MLPPMEEVITKLGLRPLVAADYLVAWCTSQYTLPAGLDTRFPDVRAYFEVAYYLMPAGSFCPFERLRPENIFVHSMGAPCAIYTIEQDGHVETTTLGKDLNSGEQPVFVLPPGKYRAAEPLEGGDYTLLTEINVPGFKLGDNEKGYWELLRTEFPALSTDYERLAWPMSPTPA